MSYKVEIRYGLLVGIPRRAFWISRLFSPTKPSYPHSLQSDDFFSFHHQAHEAIKNNFRKSFHVIFSSLYVSTGIFKPYESAHAHAFLILASSQIPTFNFPSVPHTHTQTHPQTYYNLQLVDTNISNRLM